MTVVVLAKIQYDDGAGIKTIGVSDQPYYGDATGLEGGTWYPVISDESDLSLSESARHVMQGQADAMSIGGLSLDNHGGVFDDWVDYRVTGLQTDIRRVNGPTVPWFEAEPLVVAKNARRRYIGREFIIELENVLSGLSRPLFNEVWGPGEAPNPRLEGRAKRIVLGQVFQVKPDEFNPSELAYYCADNQAFVHRVAEGGNPTDTAVDFPNGFQLLQSPLLQVTADISGPEPIDTTETDALEPIGSFETWDGKGHPEGWDVFNVSGRSSITESSLGAVVESTGGGALDTGTELPATAQSLGGVYSDWEPSTSDELVDVIQADDGSYAEVTNFLDQPGRLQVTFDVAVPGDAVINGVEFRVEAEGTNARFSRVVATKEAGEKQIASLQSVSDKGELVYGGSEDLLDTEWTANDINASSFGIYFEVEPIATALANLSNIKIYAVSAKVYYSTESQNLRMYTETIRVTPSARYTLRFRHEDQSESIRVRVAGVSAVGDDISQSSESFSQTEAILSGAGITEIDFVPQSDVFAMEFYRGDTTGEQTLSQVELIENASGESSYRELVPYIMGLAGFSETNVDLQMLARHTSEAGDPPLGWLVSGESADDVLAHLAASMRGMVWHGLDGKVKSQFFALPSSKVRLYDANGDALYDANGDRMYAPGSDAFEIGEERIVGDVEIYDDDPPGLTDRAAGAKNWHPIDSDRAAGITDEWTEQDRAQVGMDYRVVRKALLVAAMYDANGDALFDTNGLRLYSR